MSMSGQKKLIEDILSLYDTILEKRDMSETSQSLRSTISSLGYKEKGSELTSGGELNNKLTDIVSEILTTYKKTSPSVVITITSGNDKFHKNLNYKSQHTEGNAIDVTLTPYDNKSSSDFINILNNIKNAYPGFTYIDEYKNPTSAATGGHFHLQYGSSNTSANSSGNTPTTSGNTSTTSSDTSSSSSFDSDDGEGGAYQFAKTIGSKFLNTIGIKESFDPSSFGRKTQVKQGKILIPKGHNSKIKSPTSGRITNIISNKSCINQITIQFISREDSGYLEYCGITNPKVKLGDSVSSGDLLGTTNNNVIVTLYTEKKQLKPIKSNSEDNSNDGNGVLSLFNRKKKESNDNETKNINEPPIDADNEYSKLLVKGYRKLKKSFYPSEKKVNENIERIKKLL